MPAKSDTEIRSLSSAVETRADGQKMTVAGYAAVFGQSTMIGDFFEEVIDPGAFSRAILEDDVRALVQHDSGRVIGRKSAGTLRLVEDQKGLSVEIDLPDTGDGRDLRELISRGDITGMSFGFVAVRQAWDYSQEPPKRTIQEVRLDEVSVVSNPAYDGTSIAMRSLEAARREAAKHNFMAAGSRVRMKMNLDLKVRSKA